MQSVGIKATLIAHDPTASDLVGTATQANGYDLINASCNFGDCALLAKGLAAIGSKKPVLTPPLALFIPPLAYPGGHFPAWDVGIAQACLCDPNDPQVKLYTRQGHAVRRLRAGPDGRFRRARLVDGARGREDAEHDPVQDAVGAEGHAAITAAIKAFKGPLIMGAPVVGVREDRPDPAGSLRQPGAVLPVQRRQEQVRAHLRLHRAGEEEVTKPTTAGPAIAGPAATV